MNLAKTTQLWMQIRQQARIWRSGVLPGLVVVGCVAIARATGSLQGLEWMAFDQLLRWRPPEAADPLIVIVGIDETDLKTVGEYPISDHNLAKLLRLLQRDQPRAIGLDIFRDLANGKERAELAEVFKNSPNLIGIEAALGSQASLTVKPPPELPPERVGIADAILDADGRLRRGLLASRVDSGAIKYSLPLLLAAQYLQAEGIEFKPGERASDPIYLGKTLLPRFQANTGGYVGAKAGGNQILLNFRSHPHAFRYLTLTDVFAGKVKSEWIRDRVVLIGMTAASVNDTFMTSATKGTLLTEALNTEDQYQIIYGVEYQAHATSQLINAALNRRSLLHSWIDLLEYIWILLWGCVGIALGLVLQSPWKSLLSIAMSSAFIVAISYGLLAFSWWVPLIPALLALCSAGLTTSFFDRDFRLLLEQRSLTLKQTYDAVHNGPLQTLAAILRSLDDDPSSNKLRSQLHVMNQELRSVYEFMYQSLIKGENPYIERPIQDLLYEVYDSTLRRDLPGFLTIKTFIPPDFSPLNDAILTDDQRQGLCMFLQEALCNVGKHAMETSCLDVVCKCNDYHYYLQIIDNGTSNFLEESHSRIGRGTEQAKELARSLKGAFGRRSLLPQGMICELTWKQPQPWWRYIVKLWRIPSKSNLKTTPTEFD